MNQLKYSRGLPQRIYCDNGYLMSLLRDDSVSTWRKLAALFEAIVLTLNPRVKSDLWFPGDRGLYWHAMRSFIRKLGRSQER